MAHVDPPDSFVRERRRIAILAAALLVLVSTYGALLSLSSPDIAPTAEARLEALLLSGILVAISCAGILATARPTECMGLLTPRKRPEAPQGTPEGSARYPLVAHHCSCGRFADHTVPVGGRTFCAGCLGMAVGGACGIGLAVALGAGLLFLDGTAGLVATLLGAIISVAGLIWLYLPSRSGVHATANLAFVSGIVLVAALLAGHGLEAGAIGVLAAVALVGLRVEMSRWRHLSVYAGCPWQETCRGASALGAARRATRR